MVSVCIAFGIVLLALVIGAISCVIAEAPIDVWLIFAIIFIAIALLAAFIIIYYVKIIKLLNAVRNVAKTGKADPSASRFLGVVCWITALVCFFSLLMAMIAAVLAPVSVPFGINVLPVLCSIVSMIGFGVLIFKYRKQMRLCEQASYTL